MAMNSRINPNFPIPGIDQSSRGFRDNFTVIKREIEQLQNTTIQLAGAVTSGPVAIGSSETNAVVIDTVIAGDMIAINPPNLAIQYNLNGRLAGSAALVFDGTTLGIGTATPDNAYVIDALGSLHASGNLMLGSAQAEEISISIGTSTGNLHLANRATAAVISVGGSRPLLVETAGQERMVVSAGGDVGIGGSVGIGTGQPQAPLHVASSAADLARFSTEQPLTDSAVRAMTGANTGTVGWVLQHTPGNWAGGMRIDQSGTVSLHSGEAAGSQLSTSTARINIDASGKVGIGHQPSHTLDVNGTFRSVGILDAGDDAITRVGINNPLPGYELDVVGDVATTGAWVSKAPPATVAGTVAAIDTWPMALYRSARYTVQISSGTAPGERADLIECMVTHADQIPVLKVIDALSTAPGLGTLSVGTDPLDPTYAVLLYQSSGGSDRVRLAKTYLEI